MHIQQVCGWRGKGAGNKKYAVDYDPDYRTAKLDGAKCILLYICVRLNR